ncbi:MAG TPA: thioredoxin-disulfide reductase [Spirochaetota bacterium]|nr:thioredoxin-disulfide reductase [Spirochaetota bacterium]HPO44454.1 thioredoxin-disulfide reductase [Spirochaetota bacterium]
MKELVIVGAGPAGLSAAIYGMRAGIDLVVIEKLAPGGQVMTTYEVENYPGFVDPIPGWELMSNIENQARRLGAEIRGVELSSIRRGSDGCFEIETGIGDAIRARAVICATGASLLKLGVPGEAEFTGRGVSYCATCDAAFFKERVTAVVGGGDTALEEALYLTRFASKVLLVHRRDAFRGAKLLQKRVMENPIIEPVYNSVVRSINGSGKVESISLEDTKTAAMKDLAVDGVFIFIGYRPNTEYFPGEILNEYGEVMVDSRMRTSIPGLFAAGDLRSDSIRQIVAAAADGATAALSAYDYLESLARS